MSKQEKKYQFQEKAINLITLNEQNNNYEFTQQGKELITSVQGAIGVISVAGLYRTGKSYLLNRMLLSRSNGFGIGPTVNACTKGLWIWGKPILGQTKNGESINVFIIDSEGIGSVDVNQDHDNKIFALTILLSSTFIYNSIGAIDESAIQNLSLIVNLTNNIHIKSQQDKEDVSADEYAAFFPTFIWTVRDFSLQLTDSQGEIIDSKQYLEKSLQLQKGNTKEVEQKNKVRKSLMQYFKDRDCFCMFRPTNNEQDLQNLDKIQFEKLRPEFVEQVIQLRKRVLNNVRPKQLNGQNLSGEMYCDLITSYINAINSGACPNIEDAWVQICNNECKKAYNQAIDLYQKLMSEVIEKLPCDVKELKDIHINSKNHAFSFFKKKALGTLQQNFVNAFDQKVKVIYQGVKNQNNKELYNQCQGYINSAFIQIERKLRNNEYQSYYDFDIDCQNFMEYFMKNGPQTGQKKEIVQEFLLNQQREGAQLFLRSFQEQANMNKVLKEDALQKMQKLKQDIEIEINQEKSKQQNQKSQYEQEKKELDSKLSICQNQIISMQQDNAQQSYQQMNEFMNQKSNLNSLILELRTQLSDQNNAYKIQEEQYFLEKTDFEKEKLLLDQKIIFLEKGYEEIQEKEKSVQNNLRSQKSEISDQLKEIYQKNDKQVKELQQSLKQLQEINIDLESNLTQINQQYEISQRKSALNEKQNQNAIQQLQKDLAQLTQENKDIKFNEENLLQQLQNFQSQESDSLNQKLQDLEIIVKNKDEQIKQQNYQFEKEKAVFQQKTQFLDLQVNELNQQVSEHKKQSENLISTFELKSNVPDDQHQQKLNQLQESHQNDMATLQYEMENQQKRLYDQIKNLTELISDNELQNKLTQNDQIQQINKLKESLENSENYRQQLFEKTQILENSSKKIAKDCEERFNQKLKDIEMQMEDLHGQQATQNLQMQEQSEDNINQLKQYYQIERDRLEKKSQEEKKRQEKSILQLQEDYEQRIKELTDNYEENIENLQQQLKDQEQEAQNIINQYEYEIALKDQQLKNLEQNKEEMKQSISNLQQQHQQSIEQLTNNYNQDKTVLQQKMDLYIEQCLQKDKEMAVLNQKCEGLQEQITKNEYQSTNKDREIQIEKIQLQEKIQEYNQVNKQLSDELLEKKIKLSRDIALKDQENEFAQKKILDLQNQLQIQQEQLEEKIQNQKQDLLVDFKEKLQKLQEQKEYLEQKLEKNKRNTKDADQQQQQEIQKLNHENMSLNEYMKNYQNKVEFQTNAYKQEQESLQYQIQQYKQNIQQKEKEYLNELNQIKESNLLQKQQLDESLSIYDKDKALWEHKYQFLEQQRSQYKQELQDQRRKFETTLTLIRKQKQDIDLEKTNQHTQDMIQNLEKKYQQEVQDSQDELNKQKQQYEQKIQKLEKQLRDINELNMLEDQKRKGNNSYNEKKLYELLDNEKKLLIDIDLLKQERDNKNLDFQKILDNEREKFNNKILQYENKIRETEYKKQQQFFEHEKQRASWQQERDYLISQKEEVQEQLEYIGRKRDTLLKENERFKIGQKQSKKAVSNQIGSYQPIGLNSRFLKMSPISGNRDMKISSTTDQSDLIDNQKYENSPINLSSISIDKNRSPIKKI